MLEQINGKENRGLGWHIRNTGTWSITTAHAEIRFNLAHVPSGCGSVIMSEYSYNLSADNQDDINELVEYFENLFFNLKDDGVGSVITTIGESSYGFLTKKLFDILGFKKISEYSNYRHSSTGTYKQYLLMKEL
ncbi:MAG: hypothetical protein ACOC3V_01905 [bacterium]